MPDGIHTLEVWGDLACFTRPEMKVERFSYPVITPSSARGIFDAIYWDGLREQKAKSSIIRPYFYWQVRRIAVLEFPRYIALRRNEVKDKAPSERTMKAWIEGRELPVPIWADLGKAELGTDQKGRTQRQTMALKNVRYRITAQIVPKREFSGNYGKFNNQFERRAKRGQCFQQPYFGCREFPAFFKYIEEVDSDPVAPVAFNQPIGFMLYDVFDLSKDAININERPFITLFDAQVINGVMEVPLFESEFVKKPERV